MAHRLDRHKATAEVGSLSCTTTVRSCTPRGSRARPFSLDLHSVQALDVTAQELSRVHSTHKPRPGSATLGAARASAQKGMATQSK